MRDPRIDPQTGDVLEHQSGERRVVLTRQADGSVQYQNRDGNFVSLCSTNEWQEWAGQTSILGLGGVVPAAAMQSPNKDRGQGLS